MSLNPAYLETVFQVLPEELPSSFLILTAWNPRGQPDLAARNHQRDEQLARRLQEQRLVHVRITGMAPDGSHAEPGWAIDCSLDQGLELAREFDQEGLYQVSSGNRLRLVECSTQEVTELGTFASRIRDPRRLLLFTIHVGAPSPRARFLPSEELEIRLRIAKRFPSFTLTVAEGCFHSSTEDVLWIGVATEKAQEVIALAEELRAHLQQESVGVSCRGIYQLVTEWSDARFILQTWGLNER